MVDADLTEILQGLSGSDWRTTHWRVPRKQIVDDSAPRNPLAYITLTVSGKVVVIIHGPLSSKPSGKPLAERGARLRVRQVSSTKYHTLRVLYLITGGSVGGHPICVHCRDA